MTNFHDYESMGYRPPPATVPEANSGGMLTNLRPVQKGLAFVETRSPKTEKTPLALDRMFHDYESMGYVDPSTHRAALIEAFAGTAIVGWYGKIEGQLVNLLNDAEKSRNYTYADKLREFLKIWRANEITGSINRETLEILKSAADILSVDTWNFAAYFRSLKDQLKILIASEEQLPRGMEEPGNEPMGGAGGAGGGGAPPMAPAFGAEEEPPGGPGGAGGGAGGMPGAEGAPGGAMPGEPGAEAGGLPGEEETLPGEEEAPGAEPGAPEPGEGEEETPEPEEMPGGRFGLA